VLPGPSPPPPNQDWATLVQSIAAGDQLALHALYERAHRPVFKRECLLGCYVRQCHEGLNIGLPLPIIIAEGSVGLPLRVLWFVVGPLNLANRLTLLGEFENREGPSTLRPSLKPDTRSCGSTGNPQVRGCSGRKSRGLHELASELKARARKPDGEHEHL
jgi:hypothetical protein